MIILGIDPGTTITGYGLINNRSLIDFGCIRPNSKKDLHSRYLILFNAIESLLDTHKPNAIAIETQFVGENPQSTIKLAMARAIIILAAKQRNIPIFEYSPSKAKLAVARNGRASKMQVQKMIQLLFNLPSLPQPEDAADALALAICHLHTLKATHV
ncbi:MAG: crossover junction endodeoxyribonuclease RuvC [Simkaniaceae bacterium]|nr:crossover junction endodeoxyribonuclease RuvC [Simkaniaceae bacterium]